MRSNGSRWLLAVLVLAAGCGGGKEPAADATPVEERIFAGGIAQDIRCEPVGEFDVSGSERTVFACSYEEEKEMSGAMRSVDRCYVLEGEALVDVTRELPPGTACSVSSP